MLIHYSRTTTGRLLAPRLAVVLGLFVAQGLLARDARPDGKPDPDRPWTWSVEQRVEKRFNPQEDSARWAAFQEANAQAGASRRTVIPIDGSTNPGLFLSTELFDNLLSAAFAPQAESRQFWRDHYERQFGEPLQADFWEVLEAVTTDFMERSQYIRRTAAEMATADAAEQARLRALVERSQLEQCRELVQTYEEVRHALGESFDRFLYRGVAPGVRMATQETRFELEYRAGGCR